MHNMILDLLVFRNFGVSSLSSKTPKVIYVYWLALARGWIKLNTDDAVVGNPSNSSCGGVFRTARAFIKGCFYSPIGISSSFEAELQALSFLIIM